MTPKKTKPVEIDPVEELRRDIEIEAPAVPAPQPKPVKKSLAFVAYAAFEVDGEQYAEGDTFTPPAKWQRDDAFDTFRGIQVKNKEDKEIGVAFTVPGEIINKKTGERAYSRQVLPLKEA